MPLSAVGIILLWVLALIDYDFFHLLDYLAFGVAVAGYLVLAASSNEKWRRHRFEVLRWEGMANADPGAAFLLGMIPHHQGAIDMPNVALRYGTDPDIRAMAQHIIADQQPEIDTMNAWLVRRGLAAPD